MDRGDWRATVPGVAKSQTRLTNLAHMCIYMCVCVYIYIYIYIYIYNFSIIAYYEILNMIPCARQ